MCKVEWCNCNKILAKINNIIKGTYFNIFNKHKDIATPRLLICNKCTEQINVKNVGNFCNICGCLLESKTTVLEEHCPNDKW